MIYSLKDAAESDGLSGTTFIQMNYMVAIWALFGELGTDGLCGNERVCLAYPPANLESSFCVFLSAVGIGQAVIPLGLSFHRLEMIAFSLQFFIKGFKGQLTKAGKGPFLSLSKEPGDN
jgi:hypothetical protein